MKTLLVVVSVTMLLAAAPCAFAAEAVHAGIVKALAGEVTLVRDGRTFPATLNAKVFQGDLVRTGKNGKVGLILEDDTVISLGPDSHLVLESFLFQPNEKKLSLVARILHGTVSYLSGQIAKLAPNLVHLKTPNATVGVRGTHVLIQVD
ncbi:FecR family protein [Geomonas sp. Red32]|uniref:FecR family protein n=1 Tax=Geomonas sp. Red32 TaxID=2912856 RepID=UPI00202D0532|nr:FecR domain-containing protein [Geomonas sp. Red32]MCM0082583.1 FecR family protein [Geomonas sp. Red32]